MQCYFTQALVGHKLTPVSILSPSHLCFCRFLYDVGLQHFVEVCTHNATLKNNYDRHFNGAPLAQFESLLFQVDRAQSFTPLTSDGSSSSSSSTTSVTVTGTGTGTPSVTYAGPAFEDGEDDAQFSTLAKVSDLSKNGRKYAMSNHTELLRKSEEEEEMIDKMSAASISDDQYAGKSSPDEVNTAENLLRRVDKK